MSWDYRFVKVTTELGAMFDYDVVSEVGIYEVYYDEAGNPISRTEEPATVVGDTWREADEALTMFKSARKRPLLLDEEIGA